MPEYEVEVANVGPRGVPGTPGYIASRPALDAETAAVLADPESEASEQLSATIADGVAFGIDPLRTHDGVFIPSSLAALRWRQTRTRVLAGDQQGHIAVLGDSIPYGAAATGASNPKPENNYPGRMRAILAAEYGPTGGGFTLFDNNLFANPAWDPRLAKTGNVVTHTFGPFTSSTWRADGADLSTYIDVTDVCSEFWIYSVTGGGQFTVSIDGGATIALSNISSGVGGTIARESGYAFSVPLGVAQNVFRIPAGAIGQHTLRIRPSSNGSNDVFAIAIEPRIPTPGTFRVGNMSISGKSLNTFIHADDRSGVGNPLYGLTWLDALRADLLLIALGINDWQGQRSLATIKSDLSMVIDRQRSAGSTLGGLHPNGDAILVWNPKPNTATLGGGAYVDPTWDAVRAVFYEVAIEKDVVLIDMGERWKDFATANALGLFADTIHPGDAGADDIAAGVVHALFDVV